MTQVTTKENWGSIPSTPGDDSIIPEDQDIEYYKKLCKELKAELDKYQKEEKSKELSYANVASKSSSLPIPVVNIVNDNLKATETFNDDVPDFENNDNDNQLDKDQETIAEEHFNDLINQVEKLLISKASLSKKATEELLRFYTPTQFKKVFVKDNQLNSCTFDDQKLLFSQTLKTETDDEFYTRKNILTLIQFAYNLTHPKFDKKKFKRSIFFHTAIKCKIIDNIVHNREIVDIGFIKCNITQKGLDMIQRINDALRSYE